MNITLQSLLERELAAALTDKWFEIRKTCFSATDVGAILGMDPYKTRRQILADKIQPPEQPWSGNANTRHGQRYEAVSKMEFVRRTGERVHEVGLLAHPTVSFLAATPDGITDSLCLIEIKNPTRRQIVEGQVPPQYYAQIQLQLQVTELQRCHYIETKVQEVEGYDEHNSSRAEPWTGALVVRSDGTTEYAPIELSYEDAVTSLAQRLGDRLFSYRIDEYHTFAVERDDEWWAAAMPKLEKAWQEVIEGREMLKNGLIPPALVKRRKRADICTVLDEEIPETCMFGNVVQE